MSAAPSPPVNIQPIMAEVRRRARARNQRNEAALRMARRNIPTELIARISRLQSRVAAVRAHAARIGELPPAPPTLRARLGAMAVRLQQRALFWFIPGLRATHEQIAGALDEEAKALEEMLKSLEKTNARMELLLGERASSGEPPAGAPGV